MRTTLALAALFSAAASLVSAQSACVLQCVSQATSSTNCGAQDFNCLCQNQGFIGGVASCVTQTCPNDIQSALGLAQTACSAAGVSLDTAAIASATQGGASSGSSGSASSTNAAASVTSSLSSAVSSASSRASSAASSISSSAASGASSVASVISSVTANPSGSAAAPSSTGGGNGAGTLKASGLLAGVAAAAIAVGF